MTLRMIFRPLIGFKVTIMHDDSPKYALRKALVVTRNSSIHDSVVEINIEKSIDNYRDIKRSYKVPYLLSPTLLTLVNAIPAMRQLHTIQLNNIILSRMYLHTILASPCLIHLILKTVQLPKIRTFLPPKLRKLTLIIMSPWETVQPLIFQLATSLEYLELQGCEFLSLSQLQLPSFPCLQELRHHQHFTWSTFPAKNQLNELLRLGSQVAHLHVTGHVHEPVTACQKSLQYLSTDARMLSELIFGTEPFPRLVHLSLSVSRFSDAVKRLLTHSSFICDHFPRITSLHLDIPWVVRNDAIVMALSQHNVQTLKLIINTTRGIDYEEDWETHSCLSLEVSNGQLYPAVLPVALQTLELEVLQVHGEPERSATRCSQWIFDDVAPSVVDLDGTGLKSISMWVSQPKSIPVERERMLWRRWVRVSNDDWHILE